MSYIYALYFDKLNAVKIGKADDLESRLSELVSVWGKIKKGRAHKVDDIFVLKYEKELHNSFSKFKKKTSTRWRLHRIFWTKYMVKIK